MDLGLGSKKALVTGASQGIGRTIATMLAAEGCDVTLVARRVEVLDEAAAAIAAKSGRRVCFHAADLAHTGAAQEAVAAHIEHHGALDILVNNAGAASAGDFFELSEEDWERSFALKFHGYVRMCRAAFPWLEKRRGVVINNIGAAAKQPRPSFLIGGAINAALNNFTKGLAQIGSEQGVRVVSINSGPVRSGRMQAALQQAAAESGRDIEDVAADRARNLFGMMRYGLPEDLGNLVVFLASDRAQHIHGANLFIDGGQTKEV